MFTIGPTSNWKYTEVEPSALRTFDSVLSEVAKKKYVGASLVDLKKKCKRKRM